MEEYPEKLSPYGKQLLKTLGGDPRFANATPAQIKRWAADRPESIINLCPDEIITQAAIRLPDTYFRRSESDLIAEMPYQAVSRVDRRMRIHFWEEYEKAAKQGRPMDLDFVSQGTGSTTWVAYRDDLVTSPARLAWFMIPPAGYRVQLKEAQELGLTRLMDILEIPARDPKTGKINVGVALLHLQAWKAIDLRLNGPLVQKVVSLHGDMGKAPEGEDGSVAMDPEAIDKRLAELEAALNGETDPQPLPEPKREIIDVESE